MSAAGAMRASRRAVRGVIQPATEVANDLPRNGPSGAISKAWMSRADQSLSRQTPKTCRSASAGSMRVPGTPTTNATSASKSSRRVGPTSSGPSTPTGRTTGVPVICTVPDRPW